MHAPSTFLLASVLSLAASRVPAQELLAVDFAGVAYGIDANTAGHRVIGPTGVTGCNAMVKSGNSYYATARAGAIHQLVRIDPITAQATVVIANLGFDLRGLCDDTVPDSLFGIADGVPSDRLVRIDVTTGAVTTLGNTGFTGIQALDRVESFGALTAWDVNLGLVRIDRNTGVATDVDPNLGAQGANVQFLSLVTANNTLRLLGGNSTLYEIDRFTGVVTTVGAIAGAPDLRGAERRQGLATVVGTGCQSAGTANASLFAKGEFLANTVVPLVSPQHAPNSLGILVVGLAVPPPINLDPIFGTTGCQLFVTADLLLATQANAAGGFAFPFTMPAQFGLAVHFQLAALEPVPGGWSFTNGLSVQTPN